MIPKVIHNCWLGGNPSSEPISFTREKTQVLKGIALVLMVFLHTCTPSVWAEENTALFRFLSAVVPAAGICVPIYAFLAGYGFFFSRSKTMRYSLKRIVLLLVPFWLMLFCIFIPAAYVSGQLGNALGIGGGRTLIILLDNMFGMEETLNWYSWFVGFYCFSMLMMPCLSRIMDKHKYGWIVITVVFYLVAVGLHTIPNWKEMPLIAMLFTTFRMIPLLLVGYMCAKWNAEGKIPRWFEGKRKLPHALIAIVLAMAWDASGMPTFGFCFRAFYTPFLVFAVVGIFNSFKLRWVSRGLAKIGDLSMYMWFFHAIFFTTSVNLYTKQLVYEPFHNYFYTYFMTLVLTYVCSWAIKKIISPIINKIR